MKNFKTFLILAMLLIAVKAVALPPNAPLGVNGPFVCPGASTTFTILPGGLSDGFGWDITGAGWSVESSTTTFPNNVVTAGPESATLSVWAFNIDGSSATITIDLFQLGEPVSIDPPVGYHCTSSTMTYTTDPVAAADDYHWSVQGTGWSISASSGTMCDVVGGTGNAMLSLWVSNSCDSSETIDYEIIPKHAPLAINALVSGPHCSGTSNTYTVDPVVGATSYSWFLETSDPGWSATSSTTTAFVVSSGTTTIGHATIKVAANNLCGSSSTISRILDPLAAPTGLTSTPSGNNHCINTSKTYTVIPVEDANSYQWWFIGNAGWSAIPYPEGYIVVTSSTFTTGSATIKVAAVNECGTSRTYTQILETYYTPVSPGTISVASQHCTGTIRTYSVAAVNQANYYAWSVNNPNWLVSGTSRTVNVTAGTGSATISVSAVNDCGISTPNTVVVSPWVSPTSTSITTPDYHCYQDTTRYYAYDDPFATSWTWYVSGVGWSKAAPSTSRQIDIVSGPESGTISVVAHGPCGSSSTYTTTMTPKFLPVSAPERIYTPPNHCEGQIKTYACTPVANAISYTWVISGTGWVGSSNSNYIDLRAGSVTGTIAVYANTECGSSAAERIEVVPGKSPVAPAGIDKPLEHCTGSIRSYSANSVDGASDYTWTIRNAPNATVLWTANTLFGRDIELTSGSHSATITVFASNACGNGSVYSEVLIPNTPPAQPSTISGPSVHCEGSIQQYSITTVSGATSYEWSVTGNGWEITTSNTTECDIIAGNSNGIIRVVAINNCGRSIERSLSVSPDTLPSAPTSITKPNIHCVGDIKQYSIPAVPGASSYAWTVSGANWTATASTGTTINITAGVGEATISAKAVNSCGQGPSVTTTVTAMPLPSSDFNLNRDTLFKDETVTVTYTGNAGTNATFAWNFDGGTAEPGTGRGPHSVMWFTNPGNRTIRLVVTENGCPSDEKLVSVYVRNETDVNDYPTNTIKVELVPNPANGFVNIHIANPTSDKADLQIIDNAGQKVYSLTLENLVNMYNKELDLSKFPSGSYYVKIKINDSEIVKKLVIVK